VPDPRLQKGHSKSAKTTNVTRASAGPRAGSSGPTGTFHTSSAEVVAPGSGAELEPDGVGERTAHPAPSGASFGHGTSPTGQAERAFLGLERSISSECPEGVCGGGSCAVHAAPVPRKRSGSFRRSARYIERSAISRDGGRRDRHHAGSSSDRRPAFAPRQRTRVHGRARVARTTVGDSPIRRRRRAARDMAAERQLTAVPRIRRRGAVRAALSTNRRRWRARCSAGTLFGFCART